MNQISMIGRFVRDIELKHIGNNTQVVNNTLAVNRLFKNNNTEQTADFIPVTFWGKSAGLVSKYCEKGHLVGVTGYMQSRTYVNKKGETVYVVEVIADEVQFLQPKPQQTSEIVTQQDQLDAQKPM